MNPTGSTLTPTPSSPSPLPLATVVAALALGLLGCSTEPPEAGSREYGTGSPKLVLIAVDGLEPELLERFIDAGRLSNLERLIERGSLATLSGDLDLKSPVIWTSVATSVTPRRHGILDFTVDGVPVTSTLRRVPALWNLLARAGIEATTVGWMVTWPAEEASGDIVSDRSHWGNFESKVEPPGLIDTDLYRIGKYRQDLSFVDRFTSHPLRPLAEMDREDPEYPVQFLLERRLVQIYLRDRIYLDIAHELLDRSTPEVFALYLQGIDYVSHGFWQYFEPEPFRDVGWQIPEEKIEQLGAIIPSYYSFLDREIGRLVDRFGDDTAILLLSDHGFGTALGRYAADP
ncbi:MAG: alkaline phosphatase family protein, partial [Holophagales bacterium]|nr:alkaline phosphatase family protein [Holophagales bacterium]